MRLVVVMVLALAVAAPASGQAAVGTLSAEGDMGITTADARLVVDLNTTAFDLQARSVKMALVDDWMDSLSLPNGDNPVSFEPQRETKSVEMRDLHLTSLKSDTDGLLLITETSNEYRSNSSMSGSLLTTLANDEVIESHHYFNEKDKEITDPVSDWEHYYEYRTGENLAVVLDGSAQHTVTGDFTIYLWGTAFQAATDGGVETYRTGFFETASDRDAGAGVLTEQHYVHALLEVQDGTLTATGQGGSYYGESITLSLDGIAMFTDADGDIATAGGRHVLSGGAVVEGGSYDLSRGGSDVQVAVREAPLSVRGGTASTAPATPSSVPLWVAAFALLAVVGTVHARPVAVAGVAQVRYRRIARHEVPRLSLRELRADGHHRLGCRAEVRGSYRLALWHLDRSVRVEPDNPEVFAMRGTILRRLGRHREAVESHKRAHEWLDVCDGDGDDLAHNAYEAARACALAGRSADALHWLDIAVRADPDLCEELVMEPDFACVSETREFQAFMRTGGRSCGRRRPTSFSTRPRSGDHCA